MANCIWKAPVDWSSHNVSICLGDLMIRLAGTRQLVYDVLPSSDTVSMI